MIVRSLIALAAVLLSGPFASSQNQQRVDWPAYNGGVNGDHYSALAQINRGNVAHLQMAWRYDTGSAGDIQTNPLIVDRTLYAYTPAGKSSHSTPPPASSSGSSTPASKTRNPAAASATGRTVTTHASSPAS